MAEEIKNVNAKIDEAEAAVKKYASKDTVISIGGYDFTPAKLMIAAGIISSVLGTLYGAFEVYKSYQDMQTTIFIKTKDIDFIGLTEEINEKIEELKTYIPYYELMLPPTLNDSGVVVMSIKVKGAGDYLPEYAGNLDIINCAAIKVTEKLTEL